MDNNSNNNSDNIVETVSWDNNFNNIPVQQETPITPEPINFGYTGPVQQETPITPEPINFGYTGPVQQEAPITPEPINFGYDQLTNVGQSVNNDMNQNNSQVVIPSSLEEQLANTTQYNPTDFKQEKITINYDSNPKKESSGLGFVIVLAILLMIFIFALPYITSLI